MSRNGWPARRTLTAAVALLLMGCSRPVVSPSPKSEASLALGAVQQLYGPPVSHTPLQQFVSDPVLVDLNGDDRSEIIVVFGDEGLGLPTFDLESTIEKPLICRGFLVLTEVNGREWPLFYYFNEWRASIHLSRTAGRVGIVKSGGKDGQQIFWGWCDGYGEWPPRWETRYRTWDKAQSDYGLWQVFPPLFANYGK